MINPFASYIYAGYIQKCIGMNGALVVNLKFSLRNPDHIVVDLVGSMVPFKISEYKLTNGNPVILLKNRENISDVEFLKQKDIYVCKDFIDEKERIMTELGGYIVEDERYGKIGEVVSIVHLAKQKLLNVQKGNEEVLIPYHDDLIKKIDKNKNILLMNLPDGFFD